MGTFHAKFSSSLATGTVSALERAPGGKESQ
jgi:hypothetical protein